MIALWIILYVVMSVGAALFIGRIVGAWERKY